MISADLYECRGAVMPFLFVTLHLGYGAGFWRGLFTPLNRPGLKASTEVALERILP